MIRRTLLFCALAALGGCAPGDPGLIVARVLAPNQTCAYDVANLSISSGVLDVLPAGTRYFAVVVVYNQLLNLSQSGSSGPPMADPNVMNIQEARIELQDMGGNTIDFVDLPNPFTVPATGFIPSSDGMEAGQGLGFIEVVPVVYADALASVAIDSTIVASIRAVGVTAGGASVVSSEFVWPIRICSGCLFTCEPTEDTPGGRCAPSCTPGQDLPYATPGACEATPVPSRCSNE